MWRRDYDRLERFGGERYFLPAVRRLYSPLGKKAGSGSGLASWATRRYQARFPSEEVTDVAWEAGNELYLLLRERDRDDRGARLIVLDLNRDEALAATSDSLDLVGWGFDLRSVPAWEGTAALIHSYGRGDNGVLLRRERSRFAGLLRKEGEKLTPWFYSWMNLEMGKGEVEGIPEVRTIDGKWARCPACGRDEECNITTWRLVDGIYRKWTERGEYCGIGCELAWSLR